jgi:hypothetical protein
MAARATDLAPEEPDAHFEVARALGRLAQYRGVLQSLNLAARVERALERTLELDPEHAGAWHARGLFHHDVPWIAGGRRGSGGTLLRAGDRARTRRDHAPPRLRSVLVERDDEARRDRAARGGGDAARRPPTSTGRTWRRRGCCWRSEGMVRLGQGEVQRYPWFVGGANGDRATPMRSSPTSSASSPTCAWAARWRSG